MAVQLIVEVLDHAPEDLTAAERLCLIALAEKAHKDTRRVIWAEGESPRAVLCRRMGVQDATLTAVLRRLAGRGLDPRVRIGIDRKGRPVYAYEGKATEYRIPALKQDEGSQRVDEGQPSGDERVDQDQPSEGGRGSTLTATRINPLEPERVDEDQPLVPPVPLSPSAGASVLPEDQQRAVSDLVARTGVSEAAAVACVASLVESGQVRGDVSRYVQRFTAVDVERAAARRGPRRTTPPPRLRCPEGVPIASDGTCCEACGATRTEATA